MAKLVQNPATSVGMESPSLRSPAPAAQATFTFRPLAGNPDQSSGPPLKWRQGRRLVSFSFSFTFFHLLILPNKANAVNLLDKYVKRKKLDPLEVYVPAVILTKLQIKDLEGVLDADKPEYEVCRSLLRSGPAASFRVNIRAVAQYASEGGNGTNAFNDVDQCLRALEELDSLFLHASRKDPDASVKSMKTQIVSALSSLDSLLATVPADVLSRGKEIADAYREPASEESDSDPQGLSDLEIKQLESLL